MIHGAWHTQKCWSYLTPFIRPFGNILTPDMPGRTTSMNFKKISLNSYVDSIEQLISTLNGPIVLVGHSLGGLIASQAAEYVSKKIQMLIYISAYIPLNGQTMFNLTDTFSHNPVQSQIRIIPRQNKIFLTPSKTTQTLFYNDCPNDRAQIFLNRFIPEPLKVFSTPLALTPSGFGSVQKIYIRCLKDLVLHPDLQTQMIDHSQIPIVHDLESGHCPFLSQPERLSQLIKTCLNHL